MKISRTFLIAATLASGTGAAFANKSDTQPFVHDGVVYECSSTKFGEKTILRGTADGRAPFKLVVFKNKVRGTVDGKPVSFARPAKDTAEAIAIASD